MFLAFEVYENVLAGPRNKDIIYYPFVISTSLSSESDYLVDLAICLAA